MDSFIWFGIAMVAIVILLHIASDRGHYERLASMERQIHILSDEVKLLRESRHAFQEAIGEQITALRLDLMRGNEDAN